MRSSPFLACLAIAFSSSLACSSNTTSGFGDGTGGYFNNFGGFGGATGGTAGGGLTPGSGGFTPSSGGASGFVGNGGASGAGGFGAFGGAGGNVTDAGGNDAALADSGTGGTPTLYPSPEACPDPRQKKCGGPCEFMSPANGCSIVTCVDCPSVANAIQICDGTACGFACDPGFEASGNGCVPSASADAGDAGVKTGAADGDACSNQADCTSGVCNAGRCQPARCDDRVQNGRETDVDCGGNCAPCEKDRHCQKSADCDDGPCTSGVCGCTPHTCDNPGLKGTCGDTLDDHCGGTVPCGCGSGEACFQGACCDPQAACKPGVCGVVSACGSTIDCGTSSCTDKQTCFQSACCTPSSAQCPKDACGDIDIGCGLTTPCGGCPTGRACTNNTCTCDGTDTDGDGLTDCKETDDGDPWTDPAIFNGLVGTTYDACTNGACSSIDTNAKVTACTNKAVVETHALSAGWGFDGSFAARCDAAYGFTPNWTQSCNDASFSVAYTGYINLKAGTNCFDVAGNAIANFQTCASFSLDGDDAQMITTDDNRTCFNVTKAGAHAVRIFIDRSKQIFAPTLGMKFVHCFGGTKNCTPTDVVPQTDLRVSN